MSVPADFTIRKGRSTHIVPKDFDTAAWVQSPFHWLRLMRSNGAATTLANNILFFSSRPSSWSLLVRVCVCACVCVCARVRVCACACVHVSVS